MGQLSRHTDWASHAACAASDPDALFVRGAAQRQARQICFTCPVRLLCLADALDNNMDFGVWGGMTERERRALLRKFPHETNWYRHIMEGEDELSRTLREGPAEKPARRNRRR
ncbi:WhiB family transcriptional regulator, redox-sensing transcriptional regulator [Actinobaculum suis]|uniref:Transcriptional regulator WhiB n=1 Tax=Actinobaculum suis TaxID=1657 RepID=A0A1B9BCN6_9ACTO|nr:WhiB family transcriptional regulator [Actinobaculum suis]MDY5152482.1 WhiB family transcriptional regulator [Actinobaculum suis]OCA94719.1 transcription factor WhiB [Actinobaculum suis]OCA95551.1 transcription factor WhiB [Actinobaculum suis]SDE41501.1 WhiB family transcriptional regulator, redox-sensing transcriptional regulator [Actinobaculum suis]VDG75619.1 Transcription factor WhiB [Actinobaculum suis]